jgi:hypothetical protein
MYLSVALTWLMMSILVWMTPLLAEVPPPKETLSRLAPAFYPVQTFSSSQYQALIAHADLAYEPFLPQEENEVVMYQLDHQFDKAFRVNGRHHLSDLLRLSFSKLRQINPFEIDLMDLIISWQSISLDCMIKAERSLLLISQFIVSPAEAPPKR